ncbi:10925_t:CDS:2 [Ambispora gerdemannii]|uniref:10925_t:CDS:1 n=1 Tax=Ambispora gerdemannii TaxID=144530 RepID=A0A9N9A9T9_9GLOM|nr:10925_t:CDS:2 [Ambispora gerdemannii]
MGQIISAVISNLKAPNEEAKRRNLEQLKLLQLLLKFQNDRFEEDFKKTISGDGGGVKVVKDSPLRRYHESMVNISSTPSEGLDKILNNFLPAKGKEVEIVQGFKEIIKTGLSTFLGNSTIGEQSQDFTFVSLLHNAIVRIDIKLWMYAFAVKGVISECENALCFAFTLSVVNHKETSIDNIVFLINEGADRAKVDPAELIKTIKETWISLKDQDPFDIHKEVDKVLK